MEEEALGQGKAFYWFNLPSIRFWFWMRERERENERERERERVKER